MNPKGSVCQTVGKLLSISTHLRSSILHMKQCATPCCLLNMDRLISFIKGPEMNFELKVLFWCMLVCNGKAQKNKSVNEKQWLEKNRGKKSNLQASSQTGHQTWNRNARWTTAREKSAQLGARVLKCFFFCYLCTLEVQRSVHGLAQTFLSVHALHYAKVLPIYTNCLKWFILIKAFVLVFVQHSMPVE